MATAWCRNALRKQEARGGRTLGRRSIGGFLKEAPKPPRTSLEFVFDRTNALRQSHAESLFQSQFNAARVQPPGFSRRTPQRQGQPATPGASPCRVRETPHPSAARLQPPDTCMTGATGNTGASPRRVPASQVQPVPQAIQCRGTCMAGSVNAANGQMPGCRGR